MEKNEYSEGGFVWGESIEILPRLEFVTKSPKLTREVWAEKIKSLSEAYDRLRVNIDPPTGEYVTDAEREIQKAELQGLKDALEVAKTEYALHIKTEALKDITDKEFVEAT